MTLLEFAKAVEDLTMKIDSMRANIIEARQVVRIEHEEMLSTIKSQHDNTMEFFANQINYLDKLMLGKEQLIQVETDHDA
jgi:hypothetical protein